MAKSRIKVKITNTPVSSFDDALADIQSHVLNATQIRRYFSRLGRGLTADQENELLLALFDQPLMNKRVNSKADDLYAEELLWDLEKRPTGSLASSALKKLLDEQSSLPAKKRGTASTFKKKIKAISPEAKTKVRKKRNSTAPNKTNGASASNVAKIAPVKSESVAARQR